MAQPGQGIPVPGNACALDIAPDVLSVSVEQAQNSGADEGAFLEPTMAERLQQSLMDTASKLEMEGKPLVLLVAAPIRLTLSKFIRLFIPDMHVMAFNEVPDNKQLVIEASIGVDSK